MNRGDVVIVEIPYVQGPGGKKRPALVVQNDRDNARLANTIVAMISGNIEHAAEATQLLVDPAAPEVRSSGLHGPSVVKCCNLFTIAQADIHRGDRPDYRQHDGQVGHTVEGSSGVAVVP